MVVVVTGALSLAAWYRTSAWSARNMKLVSEVVVAVVEAAVGMLPRQNPHTLRREI